MKKGEPQSFSQREHREDKVIVANGERKGEGFVEFLTLSLERKSINLPSRTVFLALGCGSAKAERVFAQGVNAITVDYVDKQDLGKIVQPQKKQKERFIQADMVDFLRSAPKRKYTVVSLLATEYLLENTEFFMQILPDLSRVLKKGGVVFIYPTFSVDQNIDFAQFGLENVSFDPQGFFVLLKTRR